MGKIAKTLTSGPSVLAPHNSKTSKPSKQATASKDVSKTASKDAKSAKPAEQWKCYPWKVCSVAGWQLYTPIFIHDK